MEYDFYFGVLWMARARRHIISRELRIEPGESFIQFFNTFRGKTKKKTPAQFSLIISRFPSTFQISLTHH